MAPKPKPPRKAPVVHDYLAQRRKERATADLDTLATATGEPKKIDFGDDTLTKHEKMKRVQSQAAQIEKEVKRKELILSSVNPSDPNTLQAEENVNDMLIQSIKAKLEFLGQVGS
jgi:hypothetical protein